VVSERSTPDDPSEVRRIALPGAFRRTSQRSSPGRTTFHGHVDAIGVGFAETRDVDLIMR
jgi:hypothetical protein